jgi:hypothetical protein
VAYGSIVYGQANSAANKFAQLYDLLPTPNNYRTASGAPGHEYYQQKADYKIKVTLNDKTQSITGEEVITYTNNSPDDLSYLWLQLDQNLFSKDSETKKTETRSIDRRVSAYELKSMLHEFDGGFKISSVTDPSGKALNYTIVKTMMRIDLPQTLKKGGQFSFKVNFGFNINDRMKLGGRSGYEYFKDENNYLYTIAQFFPRMCVYNDTEGWQNKQFLGRGEFTLPFGDYTVEINVPANHIVAATGELQNMNSVLSSTQLKRWSEAKNATKPVFIVNEQEARETEKSKTDKTKTWIFKAQNVRDFAFASSSKFIWDAMPVKMNNKTVMAMSYYPKEGNPLWEKYSTKVVAHTLRTYSKHTFDYPYPVAISVHSKNIGMEYPMICFNGGRPEADGTYSDRTKHGMISVIIHEVGHNYFPMIVNSDERQWSWMDEGLNTFLQYLTEQAWDKNYPSSRGPAYKIVDYMAGEKDKMVPIMTNSESAIQFGNNAYGKPATALNILRETILGRELFDFAFKTYAQRWMFKHPNPADFFRTMEDASGIDLDWFWRGWFYTNDACDISIKQVKHFMLNTKNPKTEKAFTKQQKDSDLKHIGDIRNADIKTIVDEDPDTRDFYTNYDEFAVQPWEEKEYKEFLKLLDDEEKKILESNLYFYQIDLINIGELIMPVIFEFQFEDGSTQKEYIPAEIWRTNDDEVSKVFIFKKPIKQIILDPNLETADIDFNNNFWPARQKVSKFELLKNQENQPNNLMRKANQANPSK